jgi:hypothetical protein
MLPCDMHRELRKLLLIRYRTFLFWSYSIRNIKEKEAYLHFTMKDEHNSCSFFFRMTVLLLLQQISELPSATWICCSCNDDDDLRYVCECRCRTECVFVCEKAKEILVKMKKHFAFFFSSPQSMSMSSNIWKKELIGRRRKKSRKVRCTVRPTCVCAWASDCCLSLFSFSVVCI